MKRILLPAIALLVAGCQASGGGAAGRVKTNLAENAGDYTIRRVAILGLANTTGVSEADEMGDFATRALMATGKYQFSIADDFEVDARREGMEADYERVISRWNHRLDVEPLVLSRLLKATGYDAVMGIEVRNWEQIQIDPNQEGTSDTSVGLHLRLFAADGTLLWTASELKTEHSIPYDPEFNRRATEGGRAVTTATQSVPEPPNIRKVAIDVANEVAATLPQIGGAPGAS